MSTFDRLVDAIGRAAAEKLVEEFGGRRIYVPVTAAPESPIAMAIGIAAARTLSRIFGSERLDVPARMGALRERILRLRDNGNDVDTIARALRCTRQRVYQILGKNFTRTE